MNLADPELELIDPTPNIFSLYIQFDQMFFWPKLASRAVVKWSKRMYSCAGLCFYEGRGGLCTIYLSEPLLKLRSRKDLVETLLHEMIHAFLFMARDQDRDVHGPNFKAHMHRINNAAGLNISIYHDFHEEVELYQTHRWRRNGPCQTWKPHFGIVRHSANVNKLMPNHVDSPPAKVKKIDDHFKNTACPCCGVKVNKAIDEHLDECLSFFGSDGAGPEDGASTSFANETIVIDDDDEGASTSFANKTIVIDDDDEWASTSFANETIVIDDDDEWASTSFANETIVIDDDDEWASTSFANETIVIDDDDEWASTSFANETIVIDDDDEWASTSFANETIVIDDDDALSSWDSSIK